MRTLLFGTTYVDTPEKRAIQSLWFEMAARNPACDALIVDSHSPLLPDVPKGVRYFDCGANIGHVNKGGRDGWGRAFTTALSEAIDKDYDWAVHVEGDSLCKLDIGATVEELELSGDSVATIPVSSMPSWPETGLMFFSVEWLRERKFIERYDWQHRTKYPEPERVIKALLGTEVVHLQARGMRDDFHQLTVDNVSERRLDWLTHASLPVMQAFAA
jgi:hypothetical protein